VIGQVGGRSAFQRAAIRLVAGVNNSVQAGYMVQENFSEQRHAPFRA
jgi:hypothetical protein